MTGFRLAERLDPAQLAAAYAAAGHVRIEPFLREPDAVRLRDALAASEAWRQVLNSGDKVFELDRATRAALPAEKREALDQAVAAGARDGFQYRYETLRVPDSDVERRAVPSPLAAFACFLSEGPARDLLRTVTAAPDIAFADAQGTAYSPGDFLTGHDDNVAGKRRRAAYVLGLNPAWRIEWGGLLLFHRSGGRLDGVAPGFNTLDLFAVPQPHSVSLVTPSAPVRRYSVTGWLRGEAE